MYEAKSFGVTLTISRDRIEAQTAFDSCKIDCLLYKYDSRGNKKVILSKVRGIPMIGSKAVSLKQAA